MPGSIRSMHLKHVLRDVQTDHGSLLHGRLLWWQFDTVTLARRCRRGASTPSPEAAIRVPYSITSLARARIDPGIVRPSASAALRLMTRLNLVGCSIGRSAGFAPLRILST